jgi:hypothetical protein
MDENELPKQILWTNPGGQRESGRPKSRWNDGVEENARKLGCRNWLATAQDTGRWRHLPEEAKGCRADDDDDPFSMKRQQSTPLSESLRLSDSFTAPLKCKIVTQLLFKDSRDVIMQKCQMQSATVYGYSFLKSHTAESFWRN